MALAWPWMSVKFSANSDSVSDDQTDDQIMYLNGMICSNCYIRFGSLRNPKVGQLWNIGVFDHNTPVRVGTFKVFGLGTTSRRIWILETQNIFQIIRRDARSDRSVDWEMHIGSLSAAKDVVRSSMPIMTGRLKTLFRISDEKFTMHCLRSAFETISGGATGAIVLMTIFVTICTISPMDSIDCIELNGFKFPDDLSEFTPSLHNTE